jgi:hypothetical protein
MEEYLWIRRSLDYWEPCGARIRRYRPGSAGTDPTQALTANSFADLLEPIPNATALLQAIDESAPIPSAEHNVQMAQFYHHHHHHHHSQYRYDERRIVVVPRQYRRDRYHHHHHHHHSFYRRDY